MTDDLTDYQAFAVNFAREAGAIIKQQFFATDKSVTHKKDDTPVTEADRLINRQLIDKISISFPAHSVLGEEESNMKSGDKQVWVCDPIDGTEAFIWGMPTAMVALAYVYDGEPLIGVIYDPFLDRMFTAIKGNGAFLNELPIHVNATSAQRYVAAPSSFTELLRTKDFYKTLLDKGYRLAMAYGGMYKAALIAEGRLTARVFLHQGPHDVAAAKVLVEEAGGIVTDIAGHDQRYDQPINGAIMSNGGCHDELVRLVAENKLTVI